jgi:tetratricopeptide (TPR) repeat protein
MKMPGLLVALTVALIIGQAICQEVAWTEKDHLKIILHPDKTWELVPAVSQPESTQIPSLTSTTSSDKSDGAAQISKAQETQSVKGILREINPVILLGIGAGFLVMIAVIAGMLIYFLIVQPKNRRKSLLRAFEIINGKLNNQYDEAERLLSIAISSGLKERDLREAYFARAYIKTRLKKYDEASIDLGETNQQDVAAIYLDLWIKIERKKYKEAYTLYDRHEKILENYLRSKEMVSMACFNLGASQWKSREFEQALTYFDEVCKWKIHEDRVPKSLADHEVTLGILALLDNKTEDAAIRFESAIKLSEEKNQSSIQARFGLVLISWCKSEQPQLDDELGALLKELENELEGKNLKDISPEFSGKEQSEESLKPKVLNEAGLLKRNVLLWHAVSLLYRWFTLKSRGELTIIQRDELRNRLDKVKQLDGEMPDPDLLLGLIDYYFFPESERKNALARLEKCRGEVPEVDLIVDREKKLIDLEKNSLKTFFSIVKEYVANHDVPVQRKKELIAHLEGHARFKKLAFELSVNEQTPESGQMNLKSLEERRELMSKRMRNIVLPMSSAETVATINKNMKIIEEKTNSVRKDVDEIEKTEFDLVVKTGEYLLKDEERIPGGVN